VPYSHYYALAMAHRGGIFESFLGVQTSVGRLDGLAELFGAPVATGMGPVGLLREALRCSHIEVLEFATCECSISRRSQRCRTFRTADSLLRLG
jgi:hypothetical protein